MINQIVKKTIGIVFLIVLCSTIYAQSYSSKTTGSKNGVSWAIYYYKESSGSYAHYKVVFRNNTSTAKSVGYNPRLMKTDGIYYKKYGHDDWILEPGEKETTAPYYVPDNIYSGGHTFFFRMADIKVTEGYD